MPFTTLSRDIYKVDGIAIGAGGTIPTGTTLEVVTLTTIDRDVGPYGPLALVYDPYSLTTREDAAIRIDGIEIAGSVPEFFRTTLVTDRGSLNVLAFTDGTDTYLIPRATSVVAGSTTLIGEATLSGSATTSLSIAEYGLLPEGAATYGGQIYVEQRFGQSLLSTSILDVRLFDADAVRGNADSFGEEYAVPATPTGPLLFPVGEAREVLAVVEFDDGAILALSAILNTAAGSYGAFTAYYAFDDAALGAAGRELGDIARVVSATETSHALNWQDLGFDLLAPGDGSATPDPALPPPINEILGTGRRDELTGTSGRDALFGEGGADSLVGGAGADAFVFGLETRNGKRETDRVLDYEVGRDIIAFEDGVTVTDLRDIDGGVRITFGGDGDRVLVFGAGVDAGTVRIYADDFIPQLI